MEGEKWRGEAQRNRGGISELFSTTAKHFEVWLAIRHIWLAMKNYMIIALSI